MRGCRRTLVPSGVAPAEERALLGRAEAAPWLLGGEETLACLGFCLGG